MIAKDNSRDLKVGKIINIINSEDGEVRKVILNINNHKGIYLVTNIRFLEACDDVKLNVLNEIIDKKVERPQRKAANVARSKLKECC